MYTYITDSLFFYQKNKDFIYKNELYKWTLKYSYNELKLHKKIIDVKIEKKLEEEIIGIVSPSNYKLLFELKELNLKKIYFPELFEKRLNIKINYKEIDLLFEKYLKRSYLSFLNYEKLQRLGLNRVEQYLIILNVVGFLNYKNIDNILLNKNYKIKDIKKEEETIIPTGRISLLKAIRMISLKYNYSFDEASKLLLQLYGKMNISDPFNEEGFSLLKKIEEHTDLNILFMNILKTKHKIIKKTLFLEDDKGGKKEIIIKKLINYNKDISNYFGFQEDEYFLEKYLVPNKQLFNVEFIYDNLKDIIPLRDFVLTIKSLLKLDKLKCVNNYLYVANEDIKILKIKSNYEWISKQKWKEIYDLKTFSFNNILEEINIDHVDYQCPCCGYNDYIVSPMRFFCRNRNCKFVFDRLTLKVVEVKPILEEKMKEAFIHKKVFIRNKNGKNFIAYLRNKDNYYYLSLK
jgi:hypothetical protein